MYSHVLKCIGRPSVHIHADIGYVQGMNDLLARFLVVTESEVDSYWLFVRYMEEKKSDFLEDTMLHKVGECFVSLPIILLAPPRQLLYLHPRALHPLRHSLLPPLSFPHLAGLVKRLLMEMDMELYEFFERSECKDYLFCHRYVWEVTARACNHTVVCEERPL